jgi:hypothetical protein
LQAYLSSLGEAKDHADGVARMTQVLRQLNLQRERGQGVTLCAQAGDVTTNSIRHNPGSMLFWHQP